MRHRQILLVLLAAALLFFAAYAVLPASKDNFPIRKEPDLQQIRPKKPVTVKLKRTAQGDYSWELNGDDTDEIVRTDERLRKMLHVE